MQFWGFFWEHKIYTGGKKDKLMEKVQHLK